MAHTVTIRDMAGDANIVVSCNTLTGEVEVQSGRKPNIRQEDLTCAQILADLLDIDVIVQDRKRAIDILQDIHKYNDRYEYWEAGAYLCRLHWAKDKWVQLGGTKKFWSKHPEIILDDKKRIKLNDIQDLKIIADLIKELRLS